MLKLKNGVSFNLATASGALAFDGKGWPWEKYCLIPLRVFDPSKFIIVTKSITIEPTIGNLKWWCPWRCIKLLKNGGMINSVGMTNMGLTKFYYKYKDTLTKNASRIIVSISPKDITDAQVFGTVLNDFKLVGLEINISCPNIQSVDDKIPIIKTLLKYSKHSIGVKIAPLDPILNYIDTEPLSWLTIGNTIPWNKIYNTPSPLAKYNLIGGISGPQLRPYNMQTMLEYINRGGKIPVMYCGGVFDIETATEAFKWGAKAIQIGSCFTTRPWRINKIANHIINSKY